MSDETKTPDARQSIGAALQDAAKEIEAEEAAAGGDEGDETAEAAGTTITADDSEQEAETAVAAASDDEGDDEDEGAEGEEAGTEEATPFDDITPEQLKAIKSNPATLALYRGLMKSYSKRTAERAEAIRAGQQAQQLAAALQRDPENVLRMIGSGFGLDITRKEAARAAAAPDTTAELEQLFGPEAGRAVGKVFEKLVDARASEMVAPIRTSLGRVINAGESARMVAEEQSFRRRHEGITQEEVDAVVALGESNTIVPGPEESPSGYLDVLLEVVRARRGRRGAAEALARRIQRNAVDREPAGQSARAGVRSGTKVRPDMTLSEAFDAANRELEEEGL